MEGRKGGRQEARQEARQEGALPSLNFCLPAFLLFCLATATVAVSGCARAKAKTVPDAPLEVPAPPTRDVEPIEVEAPPPVGLVQEPARNAPPRARPPAPATREQPKAEPAKPDAPPPAVEPAKPSDEPARPTTTLQTTPPASEVEVERSIRASLARANGDLGRVDYRQLNKDARTQYDTAKRFVHQADEALRSKNLVFAKNLADKAATLAAQLAGGR
jgi:hypothetical protein